MSFKFGFVIGCRYCPNEYKNLGDPYHITSARLFGSKEIDSTTKEVTHHKGMEQLTWEGAKEAGWWIGGRLIACPECWKKIQANADKQLGNGNKAIILGLDERQE